MLEPSDEIKQAMQHSGIKGMRWGVIRSEGKGSKGSKGSKPNSNSKLDKHPSMIKYGKGKIKQGRRMRAMMDADHVDIKTGEYSNQSKLAKTTRVVDRVLDTAIATGALIGQVVL